MTRGRTGTRAMEMLIGGTWQRAASGQAEDVTSPYDGAVTGTVPVASADDVRTALDRAEAGAAAWRRTPAHERMRILLRAAELADERAGLTAEIISAEAGNAVVLKPARTTPLTALALARCFTDAGLPDGVPSVVTGPGGSLGEAL